MTTEGVTFRLEHNLHDSWELGEDCFRFYKSRNLINQYAMFWRDRPDFEPRFILELGIWDGGSAAFWSLMFNPSKYVGIDIADRSDSDYFTKFRVEKSFERTLKTYWRTEQSDQAALERIISAEFEHPLDFVIDDASHMYDATRRSFEILFPYVRPGGIYVIEDWSWAHWHDFQDPNHHWAGHRPLSDLVTELIQLTGTNSDEGPTLIGNICVYRDLLMIERGDRLLPRAANIDLSEYIMRRPQDK